MDARSFGRRSDFGGTSVNGKLRSCFNASASHHEKTTWTVMNLHFSTLSIENFRSFRDLRLEGLGRCNLISGKNNTGKSSVLEVLMILTSEASPLILRTILRHREENVRAQVGDSAPNIELDEFQMGSLFPGFPLISEANNVMKLVASGGAVPMDLTLRVGWFIRNATEDGVTLVEAPTQRTSDLDVTPRIVVEGGGQVRRRVRPENFVRFRGVLQSPSPEKPLLPCVYATSHSGERTDELVALWDAIALSDVEKEVTAALKIISPEITAVSMVGSQRTDNRGASRIAIVRSEAFSRPVPLRSFGDGVNRLFGIALSLVNAKGGVLLIDEFENGMHYTVQAEVWRAVFRIAKELDVQVFATSHSSDSIEAFQMAAVGYPEEESVLIRLSRLGERTVPTYFRGAELAIATREQIEVR